MAPSRRNKYTEEDDRLMWKYYISRLKQKDPACKHPSLQFWTTFKEKYRWTRAVSGIESHFRKYLKENIHNSGLRERYLFTAMKKLRVQMNLMDYDALERKFNCTLYYENDMTFQKALRGNTELSKLSAPVEIEGPDYPVIQDDQIFNDSNEEEDQEDEEEYIQIVNPSIPIITATSNQSLVGPSIVQQTSPNRPNNQNIVQQASPNRPATRQINFMPPTIIQNNISNPFLPLTTANIQNPIVQQNSPNRLSARQQVNLTPNTNQILRNSPTRQQITPTTSRNIALKSSSRSPIKTIHSVKAETDSPIARRTRSMTSVTPNNSPRKRKSNVASTSKQKTPDLKEVKELLIERLKMVLNKELEAEKLDDHPFLKEKNIEGFENFLQQQKIMLNTLMAENNQMRFFDKDYGSPEFKKRKPIPMPKIVKIESASSPEVEEVEEIGEIGDDNESTSDDDRNPWVYLAIH